MCTGETERTQSTDVGKEREKLGAGVYMDMKELRDWGCITVQIMCLKKNQAQDVRLHTPDWN